MSDFIMVPLENIKTRHESDEEIEQVMEEAFVTNALTDDEAVSDGIETLSASILLQENVKIEPNPEVGAAANEDPLDILNKLEMQIEMPENFVGEYNEDDFLYQSEDLEEQNIETSESKNHQGPSKSKRMRSSINIGEIRGRNGFIWTAKRPDNKEMNTPLQKLIPKGKGPARIVANMLEAWQLLVDDPILLSIVKYTNEEIKRRRRDSEHSKQASLRSTDYVELRAWLGLNYLCGIFRAKPIAGNSAITLEELWTPELGNSIFRATMTLKRFEFLCDCVSLAEQQCGKKGIKRELRQSDYNLNAVRGIWDKFIINCRSYYAPSRNCSIQEHIIDVADANSPYQHTLPNQNDIAGIRLIGLHDAKSLYMCNAVLGQTNIPTRDELLALVCDIKGTKRNITLPQRYTTLEIAKVLQQYQLSLVGALDPDVKELPSDIVSNATSKQKIKSTVKRQLYADSISIIVQQYEPQLLLSAGISHLIDATKLYAATRNAGQSFHDNTTYFSTTAAVASTNTYYRWPLRILHALLDIASLNSWLLFRLSENGNAALQYRDFQRQLGLFLTQQQLKRRLQRNVKVPLQLKLLISEILGEAPDKLLLEAVSSAAQESSTGTLLLQKAAIPGHVELLPRHTVKRNRCRQCPSKQNSKTRWQCQQCAKALCLSHLTLRCETCSGVIPAPHTINKEQDEYFK